MASPMFGDRREAGRHLATLLAADYGGRADVIVLGLPRGGVPVAYEVARALRAPLDVFVVRKLGVPGHEEYAMGAIASGGVCVLDHALVHQLGISQAAVDAITSAEQRELARREALYRGARPLPPLQRRTAVLVDDGLATGSTMLAAVQALHEQQAGRIVVAVPVASAETCERLRSEADAVVCAATPEPFRAVGLWYADFSQTSDDEVQRLLADARQGEPRPA